MLWGLRIAEPRLLPAVYILWYINLSATVRRPIHEVIYVEVLYWNGKPLPFIQASQNISFALLEVYDCVEKFPAMHLPKIGSYHHYAKRSRMDDIWVVRIYFHPFAKLAKTNGFSDLQLRTNIACHF
jgi:hypothetical protein